MNSSYWEDKISNKSVLNWINEGVPAIFTKEPRSFNCVNRKFNSSEAKFLDSEVSRLLKAGYISSSDKTEDCKFISAINVVPKKGKNTFRLVTDLRIINEYSEKKTFRNESIDDVIEVVQPNDLLITFDIKDGFFNVPIRKDHSKYFAFRWKNKVYKWNVLCFGWSLSPYYFCKIVREFIGYLRRNGLRIVSYVDDFILAAKRLEIENHKHFTLSELKHLGFPLNEPKSDLEPSHKKKFIGFIVETCANEDSVKIRIPKERIQRVKRDIKRALKSGCVTARFLACISGQLISMTKAILPTKLLLRNVYRLLARKRDWKDSLLLTEPVVGDLNWWLEALQFWNGRAFKSGSSEWVTIESDASMEGWGIRFIDSSGSQQQAQGFWNKNMSMKHSNIRELTAIFLGLKTFRKTLKGKNILVLSDNVTSVAYINLQGGPCPELSGIATNIWALLVDIQADIVARHLSGSKNVVADSLSRMSSRHEWSIHPNLYQYLDKLWGPHTCDRFASYLTCVHPNYNSFHADPYSSGVDALAQSDWGINNNFINAPLRLMNHIINKVVATKAMATFIAPRWDAMLWCRNLKLLSVTPPVKLPRVEQFCIPVGIGIPEPFKNKKWRWYAWRICGT